MLMRIKRQGTALLDELMPSIELWEALITDIRHKSYSMVCDFKSHLMHVPDFQKTELKVYDMKYAYRFLLLALVVFVLWVHGAVI